MKFIVRYQSVCCQRQLSQGQVEQPLFLTTIYSLDPGHRNSNLITNLNMHKLFGIPNCSTVKNARSYLESKKISFEFVDFKKYKPTDAELKNWSKTFGGLPVNKSGLTYKKLKEVYEKLPDGSKVKFIQENTSMIKRPILVKDGTVLAFGFDDKMYSDVL